MRGYESLGGGGGREGDGEVARSVWKRTGLLYLVQSRQPAPAGNPAATFLPYPTFLPSENPTLVTLPYLFAHLPHTPTPFLHLTHTCPTAAHSHLHQVLQQSHGSLFSSPPSLAPPTATHLHQVLQCDPPVQVGVQGRHKQRRLGQPHQPGDLRTHGLKGALIQPMAVTA